jgi:cyclic-di-GMP phosphodiesterase, flagellum assembly factor TipF
MTGFGMVRISAIFIAVCMVLIAGSIGFAVYLRFGLTGAEAVLVGLAILTALAVYNAISARLRDRAEASAQISTLARNSGDLARQLAEFGLRLNAMDKKVEQALDRSLASAQPLAAELEELSTLVRHLADSVAAHDVALKAGAARNRNEPGAVAGSARENLSAPSASAAEHEFPAAVAASSALGEAAAATGVAPAAPAVPSAAPVPAAPIESTIPAFAGLPRDGIIALIRNAIDDGKIDLFLQPIVTLPQRKVHYYEAVSRLKADNGDHVAAGDFLKYAEAGSLMPKLDHLAVLRCVQVVRRLLLKNRDIGLFCNLAGATLTDASFPHLLDFVEANRAIAPSLIFEFTQSAVRAMGPIEHESLAALADRGFRFSLDHLTDLRVDPRELTDRGFRFIKAPAALLLNRAGAVSSDIHPADLSDLLGRFGIDLIAERIESEAIVVDLLDYDVRFGQGFLFAPPRPVRAEALQSVGGEAGRDPGRLEVPPQSRSEGARAAAMAAAANEPAGARGTLAQLIRASSVRG